MYLCCIYMCIYIVFTLNILTIYIGKFYIQGQYTQLIHDMILLGSQENPALEVCEKQATY
jgi:hypothetical protein